MVISYLVGDDFLWLHITGVREVVAGYGEKGILQRTTECIGLYMYYKYQTNDTVKSIRSSAYSYIYYTLQSDHNSKSYVRINMNEYDMINTKCDKHAKC